MLEFFTAAAAKPIETADGGSIRAGIWTGVVVAALALATAIVTNWRGWKETAQAGRDGDFKRLRDEISEYRKEIDNLRSEAAETNKAAAAAVAAANAVQLQLVTIQAAFHLVAGELARQDPGNEVLKQARDLVGSAALSDEAIFRAGIGSLTRGRV